ncbi:hypothetical protein AAIM60_12980 [Pseudomonas lijiangensis]|uniref:DsbA family protein n=1 Tax=Pseudomonas lijiangensis TaxID=2995658 RepID=UPI0031BA58B5
MSALILRYLFDPLCGWCYASAPTLARLAEEFPEELELCPTGLFSGKGARRLTREFATHARTNDRRIAFMTGQRFSSDYFENILGVDGLSFDSTAMNLALTAVRSVAPQFETKLLSRLQIVRYIDGLDTSRLDIVEQVVQEFLRNLGHTKEANDFPQHLRRDPTLQTQTHIRISNANGALARSEVSGVPLLLVEKGESIYPVSGASLYSDTDSLINQIRKI